MDWLAASNDVAACQFGWLIGTATGLYAMAIVLVLIASAPAYRHDVPYAISKHAPNYAHWVLFFAQWLVLVPWAAGAWHVGRVLFPQYVWAVALGALSVVAPVMLLLMFASAYWIGRASAR